MLAIISCIATYCHRNAVLDREPQRMKFSKIAISNFKGLLEAEFLPTQFACLVGENNAGKSTVLQAIAIALNRPSQIPVEHFYDSEECVEFSITFSDVTDEHLGRLAEEHRTRVSELVIDGVLNLKVRYRNGEKVEIRVLRPLPVDENYRADSIKNAFIGKKGTEVLDVIKSQYPEFSDGCEDGINATAAKTYLTEKINNLPQDRFALEEAPLPSGIGSSISALLPEPIYIPAVRNLADELKTSQTTSFGRLLSLLFDNMSPDLAAIEQSLEQLRGMFNRVERGGEIVDERHAQVQSLETSVEEFLRENFPTAKVELEIPPPEIRTILNTARIFVDDGSKDLIDNKGDGMKRSLTFALLRSYVDRMDLARPELPEQPASRPLMFLFEEPELYLHPNAQRILFNALARMADKYQVVVTTHSPIFFAPGITASFVRVAKHLADPKPVGILHSVNFELDAPNAEVFRLARFENADAAFFSRRAVLFEGESDDTFFKHVARHLNANWDFDAQNIAMVRVSGKGNFAKFRKFFAAFGIEVKIVADLDAMFDGFTHLGAGEAVNGIKQDALNSIDHRIDELAIKAEPANRQIKDKLGGRSFRDRYSQAKNALREVQETGKVKANTIALIDGLFTWENDISRVRACSEDPESRTALLPVIDALRQEGICVLRDGAIEDYYPGTAASTGSKPERALAAAELVVDEATARALSSPMTEGRQPELYEVCQELFRDFD